MRVPLNFFQAEISLFSKGNLSIVQRWEEGREEWKAVQECDSHVTGVANVRLRGTIIIEIKWKTYFPAWLFLVAVEEDGRSGGGVHEKVGSSGEKGREKKGRKGGGRRYLCLAI